MASMRSVVVGGFGDTVGYKDPTRWLWVADACFNNDEITHNTDGGRRIVEIFEHNPTEMPFEDRNLGIDHMRRVVSCCNDLPAQEDQAKQDIRSRSYR